MPFVLPTTDTRSRGRTINSSFTSSHVLCPMMISRAVILVEAFKTARYIHSVAYNRVVHPRFTAYVAYNHLSRVYADALEEKRFPFLFPLFPQLSQSSPGRGALHGTPTVRGPGSVWEPPRRP